MNCKSVLVTLFLSSLLIVGCTSDNKNKPALLPSDTGKVAVDTSSLPPVHHIMTREEQESLTPDQVLKEMQEGNKRFTEGQVTRRDHRQQVLKSAVGQYPKAVVLSCLDSRIPVEDILDQGIGDVFVARVAGNFVNEDILGSMEFACNVSGAKLILVLGHQHCGAVKGSIDNVEMGNITAMLRKIRPAVEMSKDFQGEKSSKNDEYVRVVSENNVRIAMQNIRKNSEILRKMESEGQIKIAGAFYNLTGGKLDFIE